MFLQILQSSPENASVGREYFRKAGHVCDMNKKGHKILSAHYNAIRVKAIKFYCIHPGIFIEIFDSLRYFQLVCFYNNTLGSSL